MDPFLVQVQLGFVLEGGLETINPKPVCTKKKKRLLSDLQLKHKSNLPKCLISRNMPRKSSVNPNSYIDWRILKSQFCQIASKY